jgi:hypothetical protein
MTSDYLPTKIHTYTQNSMWYDGLNFFNELTPAMKDDHWINSRKLFFSG